MNEFPQLRTLVYKQGGKHNLTYFSKKPHRMAADNTCGSTTFETSSGSLSHRSLYCYWIAVATGLTSVISMLVSFDWFENTFWSFVLTGKGVHVYTGIIQDVTFLIKVLDFQNFLLPVSASILRRFDRRMYTNFLGAEYNEILRAAETEVTLVLGFNLLIRKIDLWSTA